MGGVQWPDSGMTQSPDNRHFNTRRMRFKDFDYRTPGYYFITVCQKNRTSLFGSITHSTMHHSNSGKMIQATANEITAKFEHAEIDSFVVMPNHAHLLIGMNLSGHVTSPESVIDVVHWWKTTTTKRYIHGVKTNGWPRFDGGLWQKGYHDRIIRNQEELDALRYYIEKNPGRWDEDTFYE